MDYRISDRKGRSHIGVGVFLLSTITTHVNGIQKGSAEKNFCHLVGLTILFWAIYIANVCLAEA